MNCGLQFDGRVTAQWQYNLDKYRSRFRSIDVTVHFHKYQSVYNSALKIIFKTLQL